MVKAPEPRVAARALPVRDPSTATLVNGYSFTVLTGSVNRSYSYSDLAIINIRPATPAEIGKLRPPSVTARPPVKAAAASSSHVGYFSTNLLVSFSHC